MVLLLLIGAAMVAVLACIRAARWITARYRHASGAADRLLDLSDVDAPQAAPGAGDSERGGHLNSRNAV